MDVELLISCMKDKDPVIRAKAEIALGEIDDARAVEPLISALKDEDNEVVSNAILALERIGAPLRWPL